MNPKISKKLSSWGKRGLAILIAAMFIGVASAAVLTHYNTITVNATVKQSVIVDGKDITQPINQDLNVIGGETRCFAHWIKNRAPIDAEVLFDTTYDPVLEGTEITTTYYKPVIYSYEDTHEGVDVTVEDTGDGWLEWTFVYPGTTMSNLVCTVAINYPDGFAIHVDDGHGFEGKWCYTKDGESTQYFENAGIDDWAAVIGDPDPAINTDRTLKVRIHKDVLGNEFLWHGFVNYGDGDGFFGIDEGWKPILKAILWEEFTSLTLQPGERLDFIICYEFAIDINPDSNYPSTPNIMNPYTITTGIEPVIS